MRPPARPRRVAPVGPRPVPRLAADAARAARSADGSAARIVGGTGGPDEPGVADDADGAARGTAAGTVRGDAEAGAPASGGAGGAAGTGTTEGARHASAPAGVGTGRQPGRPGRPCPPGPESGTVVAVDRRDWQPVRPAVVSSRSAERFAERVRMRRRTTRRRVLGALAAAAGTGAVAWLLLVSPVLALDLAEVVVTGEGTSVDRADVEAVVRRHDGVPLPRLDTVGLRREVLEVPGVRAAEVTRLWPHGLQVDVVSREPVAAVPLPDGSVALLDRDGVQVGSAEQAPGDVPVVDVPLEDPEARALTAVLTVLEQMPAGLRGEVVSAAARSRDTVTLGLADGTVVEWGSADRTALKARVVQTLRDSGAAAGARVLDVSSPTLPITRS